MSVEVPLEIFSYKEKQLLLQNLTVISQEKLIQKLERKKKVNIIRKQHYIVLK